MDVQLLTGSDVDRRHPALPLRVLSDERLARLVGQGREDAFVELYGRYHQRLFRYCRPIVGTDTDAQDALQTTFARALVALRESRRDAPIRPWLYRIAHNESISLLRRRRPDRELPEELSSPAPAAHEVAAERAQLAMLLADLAELPDRQRGALVMRELSGLSHEEIATAFGISTGAAKQTIFEARRALQEFAEGRAMQCDEVQRVVSDGDGRAMRARRLRAHMRDCGACAAFATAIPARETNLRALTPALPATAAAGMLARLIGGGTASTGAAAGAGGGTMISGAGALLTGKGFMTGAALLATAVIGTETVQRIDAPAARPAHARTAAPSRAGTSRSATSSTATPSTAVTATHAAALHAAAVRAAAARHAHPVPAHHAGTARSSHATVVTHAPHHPANANRLAHGSPHAAPGAGASAGAGPRGRAYGRSMIPGSTGTGAAAVHGTGTQGKAMRSRSHGSSSAQRTSSPVTHSSTKASSSGSSSSHGLGTVHSTGATVVTKVTHTVTSVSPGTPTAAHGAPSNSLTSATAKSHP